MEYRTTIYRKDWMIIYTACLFAVSFIEALCLVSLEDLADLPHNGILYFLVLLASAIFFSWFIGNLKKHYEIIRVSPKLEGIVMLGRPMNASPAKPCGCKEAAKQ